VPTPADHGTMRDPSFVIETRGLGKRYGAVEALTELDLRVPERSIFGFLGPNGAGKTTAMKLLVGLAAPTSGSGRIFGRDIVRDSDAIRARVGYLAQEPRFYEHLSARETLRFAARFFYTGPGRAIDERVDEMLELVGLSGLGDRRVAGFSGGERQRLGIAQAEINEPDLLIMDEPAAALDPGGRHAVLSVLERLRQRTTVLFSTHILDDVERVSDHVAILDRGRLLAQAPTRELLRGDGVTYVVELDRRHPEALRRLRERPWVTSVAEAEPSGDGADGAWTIHVGVADEMAADAQLLRTLLEDPAVVVSGYRRRRFELEEVFLRLVDQNQGATP
jgi:ABC-2 type transport system ATP-binding protein